MSSCRGFWTEGYKIRVSGLAERNGDSGKPEVMSGSDRPERRTERQESRHLLFFNQATASLRLEDVMILAGACGGKGGTSAIPSTYKSPNSGALLHFLPNVAICSIPCLVKNNLT